MTATTFERAWNEVGTMACEEGITVGVKDHEASIAVGTTHTYTLGGGSTREYVAHGTMIVRSAENAAREEAYVRENVTPAAPREINAREGFIEYVEYATKREDNI